jgi:microsomal dipeptidase-like Zn-dependent dipeptidase
VRCELCYPPKLGQLPQYRAFAFGTDMDDFGPFTLMHDRDADLSKACEYMVSKGVSESTLHKISIGNYIRILKEVFKSKKLLEQFLILNF